MGLIGSGEMLTGCTGTTTTTDLSQTPKKNHTTIKAHPTAPPSPSGRTRTKTPRSGLHLQRVDTHTHTSTRNTRLTRRTHAHTHMYIARFGRLQDVIELSRC